MQLARQVHKEGWVHRLLRGTGFEGNTVPDLLILNANNAIQLREYPTGFGKALLKIYEDLNVPQEPIACLRQKADYSHYASDLKLFQQMAMGDTWPEADLRATYVYLWKNRNLVLPPEWVPTMTAFTKELREAAR